MKVRLLTAAFISIASLAAAQERTVESAKRSTTEILRSVDSGMAEVNGIVGKVTTEGMAAAVVVADEALRTVEGLMPTIMRIGQQTERLIGETERTLERVSQSPKVRRAKVQLDEAVKRLGAAAEELEKADDERSK